MQDRRNAGRVVRTQLAKALAARIPGRPVHFERLEERRLMAFDATGVSVAPLPAAAE